MSTLNLKELICHINYMSKNINLDNINIMEVCGSHTNAIAKFGIKNVINKKINLISGPGCPVCVTHENYIDAAISLSRQGVTIVTFGDLVRVNGNLGTLQEEALKGADIKIIYSIYDLINIARENKNQDIVFLAVGFETTAPSIALVIKKTFQLNINNLYFLTSIKVMPPIIHKILNLKNKKIHGIICPGNVAVITGSEEFKFIYKYYNIPSVICGFDDKDIILGIYFLVSCIYKRCNGKDFKGFENLYKGFVTQRGNKRAKEILKDVFYKEDDVWRGIGLVEKSSFKIKNEYSKLDAIYKFNISKYFDFKNLNSNLNINCRCKDVLIGDITPDKCPLFSSRCTPISPYGPCMVSIEGACQTYYRYRTF